MKKFFFCVFFRCPVDNYVFPGLDRSRDGDGLEARFNAFKIPESNFLVFEATVRTCRDGCQPAYCTGQTGRSEPSFGRRKREINETGEVIETIVVSSTDPPQSLPLNTSSTKSPTTEVKSHSIPSKSKREKSMASTTIRVPIGEVVTMKHPMKLNNTAKSINSIPVEIKDVKNKKDKDGKDKDGEKGEEAGGGEGKKGTVEGNLLQF